MSTTTSSSYTYIPESTTEVYYLKSKSKIKSLQNDICNFFYLAHDFIAKISNYLLVSEHLKDMMVPMRYENNFMS